jgi:hypothetical protein
LGCVGIDPARGRGRAPATCAQHSRRGLYGVLQPDRAPAAWEGSAQLETDAWVGNAAISPHTGKRSTEGEAPAAEAHLWGATFRNGPPADGCWSDMPRIGKRQLPDPVEIKGVVNASHSLRQEDPLPPGTKPPNSESKGKHNAPQLVRPTAVDVYSLLTFKNLSKASGGGSCDDGDSGRWQHAWNDAAAPSRRKAPQTVPGERQASGAGLLSWSPNRSSRFVPRGGLAQERGMSLDTISKIAAITRKGGGTMARSPQAANTKLRATGTR